MNVHLRATPFIVSVLALMFISLYVSAAYSARACQETDARADYLAASRIYITAIGEAVESNVAAREAGAVFARANSPDPVDCPPLLPLPLP